VFELAVEPAPRLVQPRRDSRRTDPEQRGDLARAEAVPRSQQEEFTVVRWQRGQRLPQPSAGVLGVLASRRRRVLGDNPQVQEAAPSGIALMVGQDVPGHSEQPQTFAVRRDVDAAAPRHGERLGGDVVGVCFRAPASKPPHVRELCGVEVAEAVVVHATSEGSK
jgi:hypothetical protein